jgi:hypothetical protein
MEGGRYSRYRIQMLTFLWPTKPYPYSCMTAWAAEHYRNMVEHNTQVIGTYASHVKGSYSRTRKSIYQHCIIS